MMRRLAIVTSILASTTAVLFVACGGDDSSVTPTPDAAADTTTTPDGSNTNDGSSTDGSNTNDADPDAGVITDGGGNPDPDGGVFIDASPDASCGPPSGNPASVNSNCSFNLIFFQGGTISPGTYDLIGFTVTGNAQFCQNYQSGPYAGKLVVTSTGNNAYHFDERVVRTNQINFNTNRSYDVTSAQTTLTVTQTCGAAINDNSWSYSTGTLATDAGAKATLLYDHQLGTANVRFRWVHE